MPRSSIGNPATLIGSQYEEGRRIYDPRRRADYWLPFYIEVQDDAGTKYQVDAEEWGAYFEGLTAWGWIASARPASQPYFEASHYLRPVTDQAHAVWDQFEPIARTRYQKVIALRVHLRAVRFTRTLPDFTAIAEPDPSSAEVVLEASPVLWLPAPDRISAAEAIDTILRERYGFAQEARAPDWASSYLLPAEGPIADDINQLEQERRDLELRIGEARGQAVQVGRARLLLYEKGKDALEPIVRETLRTLGAQVDDPATEGAEYGRLSHGPQRAFSRSRVVPGSSA